jgi:hypothetical protein
VSSRCRFRLMSPALAAFGGGPLGPRAARSPSRNTAASANDGDRAEARPPSGVLGTVGVVKAGGCSVSGFRLAEPPQPNSKLGSTSTRLTHDGPGDSFTT